ncbi:hypothetical protein [Rhodocaloribacter sp.]
MKRMKWILSLALVGLLSAAPLMAQQQTKKPVPKKHGIQFVDENGDGYNDNAPDHDGDGIPNGLDPDYQGARRMGGARGFVDLDGDGINDNAPDHDGDGIPNGLDPDYQGAWRMGGARGFVDLDGDGINDNRGGRRGAMGAAVGPRGQGMNRAGAALRSGTCDGTGPKGNTGRVKGNVRGN